MIFLCRILNIFISYWQSSKNLVTTINIFFVKLSLNFSFQNPTWLSINKFMKNKKSYVNVLVVIKPFFKMFFVTANPHGLLIATDVAARGLDIPDVQHVIHYQVPRMCEVFMCH
jgi:ERCC4-related helicase